MILSLLQNLQIKTYEKKLLKLFNKTIILMRSEENSVKEFFIDLFQFYFYLE